MRSGYQWLYRHTVIGDDEVAVAHEEEPPFRQLSESLFELRKDAAMAVASGHLTRDQARAIVSSAGSLPFYERDLTRILTRAARQLASVTEVMDSFVARYRGDAKYDDAVGLLTALAWEGTDPLTDSLRRAWEVPGPGGRPEVPHTAYLDRWREHAGTVPLADGRAVSRSGAVDAVALFSREWPAQWEAFLAERVGGDGAQDRRRFVQAPGLRPRAQAIGWEAEDARWHPWAELWLRAAEANEAARRARPDFGPSRLPRRSVAAMIVDHHGLPPEQLARLAIDRGFMDLDEMLGAAAHFYILWRSHRRIFPT